MMLMMREIRVLVGKVVGKAFHYENGKHSNQRTSISFSQNSSSTMPSSPQWK
jgi:hypothetical protein